MARKMKDFQENARQMDEFETAVSKIYSSDMNEADEARAVFEKTIKDTLPENLPMPNYDNQAEVRRYRDAVRRVQTTRVVSDMRDHPTRDDLIAQVKDEKFAKYVFSTTPTKTGDADHDKGVKAHKEVREYQEKIQKGAKDYSAVAGEVKEIVEKDVSKKVGKDKRNSNFTPDEVQEATDIVVGLTRSQGYGLQVLSGLREQAAAKFDKVYDPADTTARAQYAKDNITYLSDKGTGDELRQNRFQAGRDLEAIASAE